MKFVITTILIAIILAISFICTAGLVYLVCWGFGIAWSWKISVGVWAALFLIGSAVKTTVSKTK